MVHTTTLDDSLVVPYKIKHTLTVCSSNHDPCYLLKGTENFCPQKKTCTWILIAALFTTAKTEKQPRYLSVG